MVERWTPFATMDRYSSLVLGVLVLVGLYLTSLYSYVLFHSLAEMFSIVIACGVFMLAWNSRRLLDNGYLLLLGIAYLFIGGVDLVHTLAYKGMGVFPGYDANLPTQLWIAARYMESISLLVAPFFLRREVRPRYLLVIYLLVASLLLVLIFGRAFPDCYVEGLGLTTFKVMSEYVIALILLGAMGLLLRRRRDLDRDILRLLVLSIAVTVAAEMAFTTYVSVYGPANLIGHLLKIVSFYCIYQAIIRTGLVRPYDLLFRNLKQSAGELAAINKELESFSYSVSHDLRAPLRSIDGFSLMLLEDYADKLDATGQEYLHRVRASSQRMSQIIDDLLMLSRLTRGDMHRDTVDLSALVQAIAAELQKAEPERQVEFVVTPGLVAEGDLGLLRLVLENLLGNAWKFSARRPRAHVEFGLTQRDGRPAYFVRDDGAGFDMAYAGKLFGAFQRLHRADEFPGTGIGLATVQRIIHRHGGRIWAEGAVAKGATFYFTLPKELTAES